MLRILVVGCVLSLLSLLGLSVPPDSSGRLAIMGATLIDGTDSTPIADAVVIVEDDLIVCAGSKSDCPISEETPILDATGRWLIPGLIDSHVHWQIWYDDDRNLTPETAARAARLYLASGITTVVDVGGQEFLRPRHRKALDDLIASGQPAPRLLFSGWINRAEVDEHESGNAGALARALLEEGVDGIKIRNGLTPDEYGAIVAEADAAGKPVYGHTYYMGDREFVDLTENAAAAGVDGVFHVLGIPPVDPGSDVAMPEVPMEEWAAWWLAGADLWNHATGESMDRRIGVMVAAGMWLQPTLVTERVVIDSEEFAGHPGWKHAPMPREVQHAGFPVYEGEELESYRAAYRQMQRFVRKFHEAGGMLLAGTDGLPMPGFGIHDELRLLAEAGVPPLQALQSATRNPARAWRWEDRIGTLAAGRAADLVILDADPLASIDNTHRIWRVVMGGEVYDPAVLLER